MAWLIRCVVVFGPRLDADRNSGKLCGAPSAGSVEGGSLGYST
jgi:hypothetical protein